MSQQSILSILSAQYCNLDTQFAKLVNHAIKSHHQLDLILDTMNTGDSSEYEYYTNGSWTLAGELHYNFEYDAEGDLTYIVIHLPEVMRPYLPNPNTVESIKVPADATMIDLHYKLYLLDVLMQAHDTLTELSAEELSRAYLINRNTNQ